MQSKSSSILETAQTFFELCEAGKGWKSCAEFCDENAVFRCDVLPMKVLHEYVDWMASIIEKVSPDGSWNLISKTSNESQVVFCATFTGSHSLKGGPVEPSSPPKKMSSDYAYIINFNNDGKICHMTKIWDQLTAFRGWGWPLN